MGCILVTDADQNVVDLIRDGLTARGHQVVAARRCAEAIRALQHVVVDLIIVDVHACVEEGQAGCQVLRTQADCHQAPVLFLTWPGELEERKALELSWFQVEVSDYLEKPFAFPELEARVEALLRRSRPASPGSPESQSFGPLVLDPRAFTVAAGERAVLLTPLEFDLLRYLLEHAGEVVSREALLEKVWNYPPQTGTPGVVRWHIKNLRAKINQAVEHSIEIIQTVPRHGYTIAREMVRGSKGHPSETQSSGGLASFATRNPQQKLTLS